MTSLFETVLFFGLALLFTFTGDYVAAMLCLIMLRLIHMDDVIGARNG